ncbi:MAG TPA: efflux RND transporter periplasmic adaptor subunit [Polyangia bacterium]|nr:efflux RND transporter periplasmic adaptor subunit [Polyangia bacterium]
MTARRTWIVAGAALLAVGAGVGWSRWGGRHGDAGTAVAAISDQRAPLALSAGSKAKNPIEVAPVSRTRMAGDLQLVGTVVFHEDHLAQVGPLVAGRVSRLVAGVGDHVKRGELIAEIESADVGQARAELVSSRARLAAAEANLRRESDLADRHISSERERELAQAQAATERANVRAAVMRLRAIGLSPADIEQAERHDLGGLVPMRAPLDGTVIERKVTLGQAVERANDAFTIADTSVVWVTLDLYEKDLFGVRTGQPVEVSTESRPGETFRGKVGFIVPVIDPATRTAKVRLEFNNPKGLLQPGQLVTARIRGQSDDTSAPEVLAVPRSAVEQVEGKTVVFVENGTGFERRNVLVGRSAGDHVEIRGGLNPGERIATRGAFLLKSELLR